MRVHQTLDFRRDINGLRAWAVAAVILHHFHIPGFTGGFIGVDVFFVISGFLMTGIIVQGLERRGAEWSILTFYIARAQRIVPALTVLCVALLVGGWRFLTPLDYKMLATHIASALVFVSNIKFWQEAGYFDTASHEKWLLHTWSLSVEWQFYILLPLLLALAWRLLPGRRSILVTVWIGFATSFGACLLLSLNQPTAGFYLLPARGWEMLAGGLVWLIGSKHKIPNRWGALAESTGFGFVLFAIIMFDAHSSWPSWRALVPVAGSTLVLLASRSNSALTGTAMAQWLGDRSYSLYLWHWPLVVLLVYLDQVKEPKAIAMMLATTVLLGHLSYLCVERPVRKWLRQTRIKRGVWLIFASVSFVSILSVAVRLLDGLPDRLDAKVINAEAEAKNLNPYGDKCLTTRGAASVSCVLGGTTVDAILIGDSHSNAVATALAATAESHGKGLLVWSYVSCPVLFDVKFTPIMYRLGLIKSDERCGDFLDWASSQLVAYPPTTPVVAIYRASAFAFGHNEAEPPTAGKPLVYFSEIYDHPTPAFLKEFRERLVESACRISKSRPVYLMRPIPEMGMDVPKATARALLFGETGRVSISLSDYHLRNAFVWGAQDEARDRCGIRILDPLPYLCWDGRCHGVKGDRPLYSDDDHLSEYGNKLLIPMFAEVFEAK